MLIASATLEGIASVLRAAGPTLRTPGAGLPGGPEHRASLARSRAFPVVSLEFIGARQGHERFIYYLICYSRVINKRSLTALCSRQGFPSVSSRLLAPPSCGNLASYPRTVFPLSHRKFGART